MFYIFIISFIVILFLAYLIIKFLNYEKQKNFLPKKRYCPLCNSELKEGEAVFAELLSNSKPSKILIKGCKYCLNKINETKNIELNEEYKL
ncbi:MAG TPA: hypothetical protein PLD27_04840 [bacterium]|nr:hypothetical protein [bacterium]HOL47971.1 hypothetical protein [bacterium]HPQ18041.1 hypothetical protein [bacterium]